MIIGIGGISRAGKGTLSQLISKRSRDFGWITSVVHQDQYINEESSIPKIQTRTDWEVPDSIDFDGFYKAIKDATRQSDVTIVEGLMSFYDPEIRKLYDRKIFIEITWTTFLKRKRNDLRWGFKADPPWYLTHIWDSHMIYGRPELSEDYLRLSGDWFFDMEYIMKHLKLHPRIG